MNQIRVGKDLCFSVIFSFCDEEKKFLTNYVNLRDGKEISSKVKAKNKFQLNKLLVCWQNSLQCDVVVYGSSSSFILEGRENKINEILTS